MKKNLLQYFFNDKYLKFWNTFDYYNIFIIDNFLIICWNKTMWIFNENILCILLYYNKSYFYTIKILSHAIIKTICLTI